jgi:hypothetical protein
MDVCDPMRDAELCEVQACPAPTPSPTFAPTPRTRASTTVTTKLRSMPTAVAVHPVTTVAVLPTVSAVAPCAALNDCSGAGRCASGACVCDAGIANDAIWGCVPPTVQLAVPYVNKIDASVRVELPDGGTLSVSARTANDGDVLDVALAADGSFVRATPPTAADAVVYDLSFNVPTQLLQLTLAQFYAGDSASLVLGGAPLMSVVASSTHGAGGSNTAAAAAAGAGAVGISVASSNVIAIGRATTELSDVTRAGYVLYSLVGMPHSSFGLAALIVCQRSAGGDLNYTQLATAAAVASTSGPTATQRQETLIAVLVVVGVVLSCVAGCVACQVVSARRARLAERGATSRLRGSGVGSSTGDSNGTGQLFEATEMRELSVRSSSSNRSASASSKGRRKSAGNGSANGSRSVDARKSPAAMTVGRGDDAIGDATTTVELSRAARGGAVDTRLRLNGVAGSATSADVVAGGVDGRVRSLSSQISSAQREDAGLCKWCRVRACVNNVMPQMIVSATITIE